MAVSRRGFIGGMAALLGAVLAAPVLESAPASGSATAADYKSAGGALNALPGPTFEIGDVFTIEGVYAVNPVTQRVLGPAGGVPMLQQFVATAQTTAEELAASPVPSIYPRMVDVGPYRNVSRGGPFLASDVRPVMWGPAPVPGERVYRSELSDPGVW